MQGSSEYTGSALKGGFWTAKMMVKAGSGAGNMYQQGAAFVLGAKGDCVYHYFEKFPSDHPVIEDVFRAAGVKIGKKDEEKRGNPDEEH